LLSAYLNLLPGFGLGYLLAGMRGAYAASLIASLAGLVVLGVAWFLGSLVSAESPWVATVIGASPLMMINLLGTAHLVAAAGTLKEARAEGVPRDAATDFLQRPEKASPTREGASGIPVDPRVAAGRKNVEGCYLFEAGDLDGALSLFNEVIAAYPEHDATYHHRAETYRRLGHHDQAGADFERAKRGARQARKESEAATRTGATRMPLSQWLGESTASRRHGAALSLAVTGPWRVMRELVEEADEDMGFPDKGAFGWVKGAESCSGAGCGEVGCVAFVAAVMLAVVAPLVAIPALYLIFLPAGVWLSLRNALRGERRT